MIQAKTWHEFWESKGLSSDLILATDFADVVRWRRKYDLLCQELRALLDLQPSDALLDVGCGAGLFESLLHSHPRTMVGLDLAWNMLTLSRQLNGSRSALLLLQGTATSLPFVGPAFDKVVANSVTHYLSPDQLSLMLTDLGRLLKPGGRIVIGDVEEPSLPFIGRLRRTWDRQGWSGLLRQALKKMIALVWQLYQQERERILATRGRYQPVIKPASIYRYTPDEMIRLGTDAGFQARVVPQGRGTLYPNRFNVVITHKPVTKNQ